MEKRSTLYLPEDLLVEILSRVPAKSVVRLRSTSKRWNALVKDGLLAKKHSANASKDSSLVLMVTDFRVHLVSVDLHDGNVSPSAKITSQFSLKDPLSFETSRWETRWIQARNECEETDYYALGYDNKSSCYKILCINQHHFHPFHSAIYNNPEVYDFASNSWSVVCSTTDWFIPRHRSRGMNVKGTTYWLVNCFLLSFDFSTERFHRLSLPADALSFSHQIALSVTRDEQKLCILSTNSFEEESKSYVWIATKVESTGAMSWSKFHRLHIRIWMRVFHDHNNKALLCCKSDPVGSNNILHIVGEDKYIDEDYPVKNSTCPLLLTYVPSLVRIQQGT